MIDKPRDPEELGPSNCSRAVPLSTLTSQTTSKKPHCLQRGCPSWDAPVNNTSGVWIERSQNRVIVFATPGADNSIKPNVDVVLAPVNVTSPAASISMSTASRRSGLFHA